MVLLSSDFKEKLGALAPGLSIRDFLASDGGSLAEDGAGKMSAVRGGGLVPAGRDVWCPGVEEAETD